MAIESIVASSGMVSAIFPEPGKYADWFDGDAYTWFVHQPPSRNDPESDMVNTDWKSVCCGGVGGSGTGPSCPPAAVTIAVIVPAASPSQLMRTTSPTSGVEPFG